MLDTINEQLSEIKEACRNYERWTARLEILEQEVQRAWRQVQDCERKAELELKDVKKIERLSLTKLVLSISGKLEERLDKETEEAAKARILCEEKKRAAECLNEDMQQLRGKIAELGNPRQDYEALLEQKERMIADSQSPVNALIFNLSEQMAVLAIQKQETAEAVRAAEAATAALLEARRELDSARNWGYMDMGGGGFWSTYLKRSHMDTASDAIRKADRALQTLKEELRDINREAIDSLELSGLFSFADYFFDNIFTDWAIQDKIKRSLEKVNETMRRISRLLEELKLETKNIEQEWHRISLKREREIELFS